jgi:hypothetical protein
MAMRLPSPAEVTRWVEETTRQQGLAFSVTDAAVVGAVVALLREGRRPRRVRAARRGGSG